MKREYEIDVCRDCGKEQIDQPKACECGSRNFIFGDKFTYTIEEGVTCDCGCKSFAMTFHMNANPIYSKTYKCNGCGNVIGTQTYYKGFGYDYEEEV